MAYLLDTVALIHWWSGSNMLGASARQVLETDVDILVSAVSVWEIANKARIGKLPQHAQFERRFPVLMREGDFALLPVTADHAMRGGFLRGKHRDPFDRLLAGQALVEDLTILTNDPEIAAFGCKVLW